MLPARVCALCSLLTKRYIHLLFLHWKHSPCQALCHSIESVQGIHKSFKVTVIWDATPSDLLNVTNILKEHITSIFSVSWRQHIPLKYY
jgi:hypothetical protein